VGRVVVGAAPTAGGEPADPLPIIDRYAALIDELRCR
jgi:hypothetical protein